jgi:hypothetical protein
MGCASEVVGKAPPLGASSTNAPAFYWPVALAVDPTGQYLYVASANFDLEYTNGWLSQVSTGCPNAPESTSDAGPSDGGSPCPGPVSQSTFDTVSDGSVVPFAPSNALSAHVMDSFAGQMLMTTDTPCPTPGVTPGPGMSVAIPCNNGPPGTGNRLFVTSREREFLSTAALGDSGEIICASDTQTNRYGGSGCSYDAIGLGQSVTTGGACATTSDCTNSAGGAVCTNGVCTTTALMTDPFAMTLTELPLPGSSTPSEVLLVTGLSPAPSGTSGVGANAYVTAVPVPTAPATGTPPPVGAPPFSAANFVTNISNLGSNALAVGPTGIVYVGGCFVRVAGEQIVSCLADTSITQTRENPLRFFYAAAGPNAEVETLDIGEIFNGGQTADMALSTDGSLMYLATETPNALAVLSVPVPGASPLPQVRSVITLENIPNRILVLPRPTGDDMVAITAADPNVVLANTSGFMLIDPIQGTVLADLEDIGGTPYGMAAMTTTKGYRVFVTLFSDCAVAAIDIPMEAPEQATHVSSVGFCPVIPQGPTLPLGLGTLP